MSQAFERPPNAKKSRAHGVEAGSLSSTWEERDRVRWSARSNDPGSTSPNPSSHLEAGDCVGGVPAAYRAPSTRSAAV
jgi:hypothetical protein